jgi:arginine decarboxylase
VYAMSEICKAHDLPHPEIIAESGRAMVAHHAMLIVNVIDVERTITKTELAPVEPHEAQGLQELWYGYKTLSERSVLEVYHDACHWMSEMRSMYNLGIVSLPEIARAEQIYLATCDKMRDYLKHSVRSHREILDELDEKLADKVFCNFSLFQSLPDAWAIDQIFPIMSLSGLHQKPTCRGVLQDITCDSDGRIDTYVDGQGVTTTLPLVPYSKDQPHLLGIFLVGAYQEILGDMHNLFGDTHSVQIELDPNSERGYKLLHPLHGDRVEQVLRYVQFEAQDLIDAYHQKFLKADLSKIEASEYLEILMEGLKGYTYLED